MITLVSCSSDIDDGENVVLDIQLTSGETKALQNINEMTFELISAIEEIYGEKLDNYVFSPQGVAWDIIMMANGVVTGSSSEKQLLSILKLEDGLSLQDYNECAGKFIKALQQKGLIGNFNVANAFQYKDGIQIESKYIDKIKSDFNALELKNPTNDQLDNWIQVGTEGNLKYYAYLNQSLNTCLSGFLNTMFLNVAWTRPYGFGEVCEKDFYNFNGSIGRPIYIYGGRLAWIKEDETSEIVELPFADYNFIISFVIPKREISWREIKEHDGTHLLNLNRFDFANTYDAGISMPRLNISCNIDFSEVLSNMGLTSPFSRNNDFTKIYKTLDMSIHMDQICMTTIYDFNVSTNNTRATTETRTYYRPPEKELDINKPFYYFITERSTGAILFAGKVSKM